MFPSQPSFTTMCTCHGMDTSDWLSTTPAECSNYMSTGIILWMRPADERRHYMVTSAFIDWAHRQNDPWSITKDFAIVILCNSMVILFCSFLDSSYQLKENTFNIAIELLRLMKINCSNQMARNQISANFLNEIWLLMEDSVMGQGPFENLWRALSGCDRMTANANIRSSL